MTYHRRGRASLLAILATVTLSVVYGQDSVPGAGGSAEPDSTARPPASETTPSPDNDTAVPRYRFAFRLDPDTVSYYVIENEIRDLAAIPGWLSSTTTLSDKRYIIQRVRSPKSSAPAETARGGLVEVSWECDRYEVRERGMQGETTFDSLRDSFPPPTLRDLGKIPGSRSVFSIDPLTGQASRPKITPAEVAGPATRKKLSSTAKKCRLTNKALQDLIFDLGPLYFPTKPQGIGEEWTKTHETLHDTFGTVITRLNCAIRTIREVDGRQIATIDIAGEMTLKPRPAAATKPASSQPGRRRTRKSKTDFKVQVGLCSGSVQFDLTRGELVEMTLRRELDCIAELKQTKAEPDPRMPTEIRSATSHVLRVKVSRTPPPKPIIVGGPKPPDIPPEKPVATRPTTTRGVAAEIARRRAATTRKARPPRGHVTKTKRPSRPPPRASRKGPSKKREGYVTTRRSTDKKPSRRIRPPAKRKFRERSARPRGPTSRPVVKMQPTRTRPSATQPARRMQAPRPTPATTQETPPNPHGGSKP